MVYFTVDREKGRKGRSGSLPAYGWEMFFVAKVAERITLSEEQASKGTGRAGAAHLESLGERKRADDCFNMRVAR